MSAAPSSPPPTDGRPRVAYLVNQYPKVSHAFIRREILALEGSGLPITRFAIRGWADSVSDPQDEQERQRTRYLLQGGALPLLRALLGEALARPGAWWRALRVGLDAAARARRPAPLGLVYLAEACLLKRWCAAAGIRHLHAHFGTNSATVARLQRLLGGARYSFTVHGPEEFDKPEALDLAGKIRDAEQVVAISSFGRSQLMRWVPLALWPRIKVVHCGLEAGFHTVPDQPPAPRRLVCVGRLCEQKGQLLLMHAAARLAAREPNFELVLAGDGEMRPEVEALIREHGLQRQVRITGWISSAQVRAEIQAARALVLPSFAEGLPVVLMEAMALRRPVLSTSIAGIPELVRPGQEGWLVPAGDVDALTDALQAVLDAPAERIAALGEAARQRVLARHDVDTEAAKLRILFSQPDRVAAA